ncbi:hypothetical protein [Paucibacter sp. Y2R2-4]|uniref:hypothetical protein n=1 Tax=Paucibacter sp. Y2R2-4 TaxID=2893553 RepID=UPI0021E46C9B|nr:hypothetical protein [Paucibacter sp. Y2R2-4]MCV2350643.1 hypothetical protein [Paucibacter sp. Y2R2-4]
MLWTGFQSAESIERDQHENNADNNSSYAQCPVKCKKDPRRKQEAETEPFAQAGLMKELCTSLTAQRAND